MAGDFTLGLSGDIGVDCDFGLDGDFCLDGDAGLDGDVGLGAGGDLTLVDVDGVLVGDAGLGGEISLVGDTLIFLTIVFVVLDRYFPLKDLKELGVGSSSEREALLAHLEKIKQKS